MVYQVSYKYNNLNGGSLLEVLVNERVAGFKEKAGLASFQQQGTAHIHHCGHRRSIELLKAFILHICKTKVFE